MTNWIVAGARSQPVVLALEDVHWADPTTLDFIRGIAERGALVPLLLLITARPEFRPPWGMRSHHAVISLAPLDRHQVRDMVAELSARHALSNEVVEGVTERTGGVPLFVEEVTRLLLEHGEQGGVQAIPPTLQQSLTARLDRLGPAREVALIGALIGRDFSYPLLRAVTGMEDGLLRMALERLAEADILLVQGLPPESEYRFKHVLIQDAAYENLLKSRRQVLHRRVGEAAATTRVTILAYTMPIWAVLLAWAVLRERPNASQTLAVVLCALGLAVLIYPLAKGGVPLGLLLALAAGAVWGAGTVYIKWAQLELDPLGATFWQLVIAFGAIAACLIAVDGRLNLDHAHANAILAAAFAGIFGSGVAYATWLQILRRLPAATASLGALGIPVVGVVSTVLITGEKLSVADIIGFALIFAASASVLFAR